MNKLHIIKELAKTMPSEREAKEAVNRVFEIILEGLRRGEKVVVSNFGTFRISNRKPIRARNPKTNEKVMVGPRKSVRFRISKKIIKSL